MRNISGYRFYLFMAGASAVFTAMIYTVVAVYYVRTVGMNPLQLVLVGTALEVAIFLFEIPTGVVADVYSRKLSVILGDFLLGTCFVLEGLVPLFATILLAEVIRGVGETFISGALQAWVADEVGEERVRYTFLRGGQVRSVGGLLGIFVGVALASYRLNLPVAVGGLLLIGLSVFMAFAMPETGFRPVPREERDSWRRSLRTMGRTARDGVGLVRGRPLLVMLIAVGVVAGAHSEGLDRLWEAHLLKDFAFPRLGELKPVVWFGIIGAAGSILGLVGSELAIRRLPANDRTSAAQILFVVTALQVAGVVVFGLASNFTLAVCALLAEGAMGAVGGPIYAAWLNRNIEPRVRATVLSLNGQADSLGQLTGGPAIGAIGTAFGLRAAIVVAGAMLSPALLLYSRALRRGSPEQVPAEVSES